MAYVSGYNQQDEEDKLKASSGSGILGTSGVAGGSTPSKTAAGTPGGWTNIQEYLGANQGDMTNVNTLRNKATGMMGKGVEEINKQKASLSTLPISQTYDPAKLNEYLGSNDYSSIRSATNQQAPTYTPTNQELLGYTPLETGVSNLKEGDFGSIENFFGAKEASPGYTPGMQSFDSMLLQGNPYVQKEFVPEIKNMYAEQYQKPLEAARTEREAAKTKASSDITAASEPWKTALKDWAGGEKGKVNTLLSKQQQHYSSLPENIKSGTGAEGKNWTLEAPDMNTAINEYLSTQGNDDYNAIQDILALYGLAGGGNAPAYLTPTTSRTYNYPMGM